MLTRREKLFVALIILITLAAITVHWFWIPLAEWRFETHDHKELAEFGETYIIFHSFFDLLAWAVVITALVLQFRDARERDRQFARQMEAQTFQSVFFPYLSLFQTYVENLECGSLRGRRVFSEWHSLANTPSTPNTDTIGRACDDYGAAIDYYHKHLETLLRFILVSEISSKEKRKYFSLLHSQLSDEELSVVTKYCEFAQEANDERKRRRECLSKVVKSVETECQADFCKPQFLL
jgi:Putative phage abortive infection protein